jgi:diguanylate cyclase (GGDEF)-like protein
LRNYEQTRRAKVIGVGRVETALRKNGEKFPMHLTVADISDGSTVRFVGVIRDLSVYQQRDELQNLIRHDSLTGLPNRTFAAEVLDAAAGATDGPGYSVLFCDVDRFKRINDTYGHRVGDEVLKAIALRLRKAVSDNDFVARLAGDEFLVVLHGVDSPAMATEIAQRVTESVSHPVSVGDLRVECSVSIGAASAAPGQAPQRVIEIADQKMYDAKRSRHSALTP